MRSARHLCLVLALVAPACARVSGDDAARDPAGDNDSSVASDASASVDGHHDDGVTMAPDAIVPDTAARDDGAAPPPSGPACSNGIDDDGDGLIDPLDPECTGPLDDDEASFGKGIPGDGEDGAWTWCKLDCAFDGNSGSGDDGCVFSGTCHRLHSSCTYDPIAAADPTKCPEQPSKCASYCAPRTPNGCDYAGCCDVFDASGAAHRVRLNRACSMETLSDPTRCWPCERIEAYAKPCGRCDVCIGKTKLPSDCDATCANGGKRCGEGTPCIAGEWCLTGCCTKIP